MTQREPNKHAKGTHRLHPSYIEGTFEPRPFTPRLHDSSAGVTSGSRTGAAVVTTGYARMAPEFHPALQHTPNTPSLNPSYTQATPGHTWLAPREQQVPHRTPGLVAPRSTRSTAGHAHVTPNAGATRALLGNSPITSGLPHLRSGTAGSHPGHARLLPGYGRGTPGSHPSFARVHRCRSRPGFMESPLWSPVSCLWA